MFLKNDSRWKQQRNISEVTTGIETKKNRNVSSIFTKKS